MLEQKIKAAGRINAVLRREDGSEEVFERNNLIVDAGVDFICDAMGAATGRPGVLSHIGVGEGTTAADAEDTDLEDPLIRKAGTYAHDSGTSSFTMTATFDPGEGTGDITEAALFNASSAGTMLNRVVFSAIPKEAGDTLDITFTITFTPS